MEANSLEEYNRIRKIRIGYVVTIVVIICIICAIAFSFFRISVGGHLALREAKNVKLAFKTLSVEYYGQNKSVFNPYKKDGLEDGVKNRLKDVVSSEQFDVRVLNYDVKSREVKEFIYETPPYRVIYRCDDDNESWKVDYIVTIQKYSQSE